MAPTPGRSPSKNPSKDPRAIGPMARCQSSRLGKSPLIFPAKTSALVSTLKFSSTSAMPNSPITTGAMPMPSASSSMPNVNRGVAVIGSRPTHPRMMPKTAIIRAFAIDFGQVSDYSQAHDHEGEVLGRPEFESEVGEGRRQRIRPKMLTVPAMKEPNAEIPRANWPAFRAIW